MSTAKPARSKRKKAGTPAPEEAAAERPTALLNRKGLFTKDLAQMMYGFGDDITPYRESVDLVEELVTEFVIETMHKVMAACSVKGGKPTTEDLMFLVRKDTKKYNRVKELLYLQKEIAKAKKAFEAPTAEDIE